MPFGTSFYSVGESSQGLLLAKGLGGRMVLFSPGPAAAIQPNVAEELRHLGTEPGAVDYVILASLGIDAGSDLVARRIAVDLQRGYPNARFFASQSALSRPENTRLALALGESSRLESINESEFSLFGGEVLFNLSNPLGLTAQITTAHGLMAFGEAPLDGVESVPIWPKGFRRIPDRDLLRKPTDLRAAAYDAVKGHRWYGNLDPTVRFLEHQLRDGDLIVDYSAGTGILEERLLPKLGNLSVGIVTVDASAAFLSVAMRKFSGDDRVAFRQLRFLKEEGRLQRLDEVVDFPVDGIVCANAVHLYPDLAGTFAAWKNVLKPGGWVHIQSGNIQSGLKPRAQWLIDDTVRAIHDEALRIVVKDDRFAAYREAVRDQERTARYLGFRDRVFLPIRPLEEYLDALRGAGFKVTGTSGRTITAGVQEWHEFLTAYSDGVLGWVGGVPKLGDPEPSAAALTDRHDLMRLALERLFPGRETFQGFWTYINATAT